MSLEAEPSAEEIQDHLEPTAAGEVHVDLPEWAAENSGLAWGLLAFGTMVRELPGAVTASDDVLVRLELQQGGTTLCGLVSVGHGGGAKIAMFGLTDLPADGEREADRIRLLYDRIAGTYEELSTVQAHYWDHARAWLAQACCDGFTVLDVGCGPGHLSAGLPLSVRVIGCDLSPEMVRLAALARPTGRFAVHDYHQPFPAQWPLADITVALGCLEFCADLSRVARNLAAATKAEGRLLLTLPRAQRASPQREIPLRPFPFSEITVHLREDAEVAAELGAAGLEVTAHDVGPGWTAPWIGTVEYGYWQLKVVSVDMEVPRAARS